MLTIKIDETKYALEMGIKLPEGATVMTVKDKDELMGIGVMRIFEGYALLDDICIKEEFRDFSLEYGLGKSMLNVIDLRGIRYVASSNDNIQKQLTALRFRPIEEAKDSLELPDEILKYNMYLNLDGYFVANC